MHPNHVPLADQCADQLSTAILGGEFVPGQRLDEVALGEQLSVSRNTLREAFRMLAHEQLVEHHPNRGVFVRRIDATEARHLYVVRRHLELGALDELSTLLAQRELRLDEIDFASLAESVELAEGAREEDDWVLVGTANALFHVALVELAGNPVANRFMRTVVAQTRLRYLGLGNPRSVHESFLDENRKIAQLLAAGHLARARAALELYLLRAEGQLA